MKKSTYDVVITGAGPSGLACAVELCTKGLEVAFVDEQARPGAGLYQVPDNTLQKKTRRNSND